MPGPTAHSLIQGTPFGSVQPPRPFRPLPAVDGRTVALKILRKYISELVFSRPDQGGRVIPYRIPEANIHLEMPDNVEKLVFPSIAFLPSDATHDVIGLTAYYDESTLDRYGKGLVVMESTEYREVFTIATWATLSPERRSMKAGLEDALVPVEQMYGLRFIMPDYYDRTVCFSLFSSSVPDDPAMAATGRRWALLQVEMRFNEARLVDYTNLTPQVVVEAAPVGDLEFQLNVEGFVGSDQSGNDEWGLGGEFGQDPYAGQ